MLKAPSVTDIAVIFAVLGGMQAAIAQVPDTQWWLAPALSAGLLAVLKILQLFLLPDGKLPVSDPPPGAAAINSAKAMEKPGRLKSFFTN